MGPSGGGRVVVNDSLIDTVLTLLPKLLLAILLESGVVGLIIVERLRKQLGLVVNGLIRVRRWL